jgi:hypothetical protein
LKESSDLEAAVTTFSKDTMKKDCKRLRRHKEKMTEEREGLLMDHLRLERQLVHIQHRETQQNHGASTADNIEASRQYEKLKEDMEQVRVIQHYVLYLSFKLLLSTLPAFLCPKDCGA